MPPFDSVAQNYGLVVAVLIFGFVAFVGLILRGDLVPGKLHRDRIEREEKITNTALDSNAKSNTAIEKLTAAFEAWRAVERREGPR